MLTAALGAQVVIGALTGSQRGPCHDDAGYDGALEQRGRQRPAGPVRGPRQLGLQARDARAHHVDRDLVGEDHPRTGVGEHPRDLLGGRAGVERDGDGLHAQDGEVGDHHLGAVGHREGDAVPGDDPRGDQPVGDAGDLLLQLAPGQAGRAVDERRRPGVLRGGRGDEVGEGGVGWQRGCRRGRRSSGTVGCSVLGHAFDLGTAPPLRAAGPSA